MLEHVIAGLVLGWSVAWPPGPINAEIVRRGLARGFAAAFAVGAGASAGDAVWALAVGLAASLLAGFAVLRGALAVTSFVLLVALGSLYLWGAYRRWLRRDGGEPPALDGARGGFLLGFGLALTSPFNIAFWLAVVGRPEIAGAGPLAATVIAASVIGGTLAWVTSLTAATVLLRARYGGPTIDIVSRAVTGLVLFYFAWGVAIER